MKRTTGHKQSGFTLVEMIVSLGLFSVVITVAVGALLVLIASNTQAQNRQVVVTNLSFALDSMTREIRTGTEYYCDSQNSVNAGPSGKKIFQNGGTLDVHAQQDCQSGNSSNFKYHGISFLESGQSVTQTPDTRIVYFFDDSDSADGHKLYRRISGGDAEPITPSNVDILDAQFYVTGSERLNGNTQYDQPSVTIYIKARDNSNFLSDTYEIETTVVQRVLDI